MLKEKFFFFLKKKNPHFEAEWNLVCHAFEEGLDIWTAIWPSGSMVVVALIKKEMYILDSEEGGHFTIHMT